MADEVQKIKQEIERQIEEGKVKCQQSKENNDHESFVAWSEHVATCGKLLVFINSLLKEPASEDKSERELSETYLAIFDKKYPILPTLKGKQKADFKNFLNKCQQEFGLKEFGIHPTQSKLFEKLTLLWAAWGAEHLGDLGKSNKYEFDKEPISKDLEEEIDRCWEGWIDPNPEVKGVDGYLSKDEFSTYARHFAEWQKEKDYKMYAHVPLKDIHDAWQELKKNKPDIENYPAICFQKGVDLQKQKDIEELDKKPKIKVWIARDKTHDLHLFSEKPWRNNNGGIDWNNEWIGERLLVLDCNLYPELTWESEPIEIELILNVEK